MGSSCSLGSHLVSEKEGLKMDSEGPLSPGNRNKVFDAFETFMDAPLAEQLLA